MLPYDCPRWWNLSALTADSNSRCETPIFTIAARIVSSVAMRDGGTDVAVESSIHRDLRLCGCWAVNSLVTSRHRLFMSERLPRPPHCSNEGVTGESGPLIFYTAGLMVA